MKSGLCGPVLFFTYCRLLRGGDGLSFIVTAAPSNLDNDRQALKKERDNGAVNTDLFVLIMFNGTVITDLFV